MRRGLRFTPKRQNEGAAWLRQICGASFVRLHPAGLFFRMLTRY